MKADLNTRIRIGWLPSYGLAVVFHGLVGVLFFLYAVRPAPVRDGLVDDLMVFRLVPPAEGNSPVYMISANPDVMPPVGQDGVPDGDMVAGGNADMPMDVGGEVSDAELAELLAEERVALRKELEQLSELADAKPAPGLNVPLPKARSGDRGAVAQAPQGAIRELDLEGYPQGVVDEIMQRYGLKVVTREIKGGHRGQNFLSSASKGGSDQYFGGMDVPAGIYEIFQLSRESVATMSRLEEKALEKEGLEPLHARVVKIVFGIVKADGGGYELGVKSLKAEAVSP